MPIDKQQTLWSMSTCSQQHHAWAWSAGTKYGEDSRDVLFELRANHGQCQICRRDVKMGVGNIPERLVVDHDHETGKYRGLICNHCNAALGYMRDNIDALRRAAHYLKVMN